MIVNVARLGKQGSGMWVFSIQLIICLKNLGKLDCIICPKMHEEFFKKYNCKLVIVPDIVSNTVRVSKIRPILWMLYSYWLSIKLNFLFKNKFILSTTHHYLPLFLSKQIITIHDLRPYYYPDSKFQKIFFRYLLKNSVNHINHINTVSYTVKNQLCDVYGLNESKVSVIYNAIGQDFFDINKTIPDTKFLLAVGVSWKHKNIHTLINNYKTWVESYKLIIVAGETDYIKDIKILVKHLGINDNVCFLHNLTFSRLKELYSQATAIVYPSLDEGFGIPPIEAFATGIPAIVSNISVFHEILEDNAIYVEPNDEKSWFQAFEKLNNFTEKDQECLKEYAKKYTLVNMQLMLKKCISKLK